MFVWDNKKVPDPPHYHSRIRAGIINMHAWRRTKVGARPSQHPKYFFFLKVYRVETLKNSKKFKETPRSQGVQHTTHTQRYNI